MQRAGYTATSPPGVPLGDRARRARTARSSHRRGRRRSPGQVARVPWRGSQCVYGDLLARRRGSMAVSHGGRGGLPAGSSGCSANKSQLCPRRDEPSHPRSRVAPVREPARRSRPLTGKTNLGKVVKQRFDGRGGSTPPACAQPNRPGPPPQRHSRHKRNRSADGLMDPRVSIVTG